MIRVLFTLLLLQITLAVPTENLGESKPCLPDQKQGCEIDGYVANRVIYEDNFVRVWNFTLEPGEFTSMHRHDHDYHFIVNKPTILEVWDKDYNRLYDFKAEGVMGFKVEGDYLEPVGDIKFPTKVPRIHSAKNIGNTTYNEILVESKTGLKEPVKSDL